MMRNVGYGSLATRLRADVMVQNCGLGCATAIAKTYALAGDSDDALGWLRKGYDERQGQVPFIKVDPVWDSMRSDPRFQAILRKMSFPS